ncbi:hypothetical protein CRUP_015133 [Coryphaenoides rupestris]|nr:hypothetical protein CRUP_015133 [Coryphaenoides rupestris]
MSNPAPSQKQEGADLWLCLLSLGFQPETSSLYENGGSASKVLASLFLSPGGPKFTSLMLHLASHVMLQEMNAFTTDGTWAPEEASAPTSSLDMAMKRFKLTRARCIKAAVQQDHLLQEFQRRAQSLVKSIQEIRNDEDGVSQEGDDSTEKLHKVRVLWSAVDEMLSALGEQRRVVAGVLKGDADQFVLDGAGVSLKVPRVLLEKIERLPQQLNPLCMLELMAPALHLLQEERSRVVGPTPLLQLRPQELQTKSVQAARVLEDLKVLRQKILKEEIPEVRDATRRLQADWDRRWRDTLENKPLASFPSDDPALCFLSPMAPLSFEPVAGSACDSSVFCRYAAKLPEEEEQKVVQSQEVSGASYPEFNRSDVCRSPMSSPACDDVFFANTSLQELLHTPSPPPKAPTPTPRRPVQPASTKTIPTGCKVAPVKNKAKILDWECDNLAEQFAEAITTTSPMVDGKRDGLALEDLLCNLGGDPFSMRRQLPRTPESLILDVKSSWRKAVEESKVQMPDESLVSEGACISIQQTPQLQSHGDPFSPLTLSFNGTPCGATPTATSTTPAAVDPSSSTISSPTSTPTTPAAVDPSSPTSTISSPTFTTPVAVCLSSPTISRSLTSITIAQNQQASLVCRPAWDSLGVEALHSLSGMGRGTVHFSLDDETMPDLPDEHSLLSLSDEDDSGLHLPPCVSTGPQESPQMTSPPSSCLGRGFLAQMTPTTPLVGLGTPGSDLCFTLDLEALEGLTPPRQEYSMPTLIPISPMDDL